MYCIYHTLCRALYTIGLQNTQKWSTSIWPLNVSWVRSLAHSPHHSLHQFMSAVLEWSIPKKTQPWKWRLIVDLSFPEDASVNDEIATDLCSLHYPPYWTRSPEDTVGRSKWSSPNCTLGGVPVHSLTGLCWVCIGKGSYYTNTRLPFGLTSAPKLLHGLGRCSTVADKTSSRVCPELLRWPFLWKRPASQRQPVR